jgi:N-acetylglucosamine malate deacetylase 1
MKLDILVIVAHPDDAELSCGGTIIKHVDLGYKVGIIDLTEGELGTRGTAETRQTEAQKAAEVMGISVRDNMRFRDGWFRDDEEHRMRLIGKVREYQPSIVITNAPDDRHPDHGRAANLVKETCWLAGLKKVETKYGGKAQDAWRPPHIYHFIQYVPLVPDFVVDVSGYWERKMEAIMAYRSQFYDPESKESDTLISRPEFMELIKAKLSLAGSYALINQGEGFISAHKPAVDDLFHLK